MLLLFVFLGKKYAFLHLLCGDMSVDMPTAMPVVPFNNKFGKGGTLTNNAKANAYQISAHVLDNYYEAYEDELYTETGIPPFLHMKNGNVMHAHALNGYAAMLAPRAKMSVGQGATKWDAMRTDIIGEPRTPVFEVQLGKLVRFRFLNVGSASSTHSFHVHGHVWVDETTGRYADSIQVPSGGNSEIMFYAGGGPFLKNGRRRSSAKRSGTGDWLYHCHVIPHVKHGMWGIFRVTE